MTSGVRTADRPAGPLLGQEVEVEIGPVAHGGHCVARHQGRVVFVRHALPGERVVARVTEDGGRAYCRADAVRVLRAAPDRVPAPCPHAGPGHCGGCDWQHATGEAQRRLMAAAYRKHGRPAAADDLEATRIDPPEELVDDVVPLTVGGRPVQLRYLGRGHTDNDLVVAVADAAVLFAGDLVEQGAPPAFEDAFPLDWPATLDAMLELAEGPVVPGHGDVVDRDYVLAQRADIGRAADAGRSAYAEGRPVEAVLAEVPFPAPVARSALERAFRQLRGDPPYDPPEKLLRRAGIG